MIVNGNKVQELALEPKDTIAAGSSRFVTDFLNTSREIAASSGTNVGAIPAQAPDTSTIASCAQLDETQRAIVETFALLDGTLYCILDAAQDDMIIELLHCSNAEYQILYEGASAKDLASFGPYLVKLPPQNSFLPGLIKNGWGKNWGVYLKTNAGFAEVRKHLRHFLTVKTPEGKQVYFRFYDPRIMRMVVAGFNSEESALFFGPIHSYLCESSEPSEVLRLSAGPQGVETRLYRCTGKTAVPLESEAFSLAVRGGRSTR